MSIQTPCFSGQTGADGEEELEGIDGILGCHPVAPRYLGVKRFGPSPTDDEKELLPFPFPSPFPLPLPRPLPLRFRGGGGPLVFEAAKVAPGPMAKTG